MKKWLITGLFVLALVIAGKYAHWWVPRLLPFLEKNGNLIKALTGVVQLVLWAGGAVLFIIGLWKSRAQSKDSPPAVEVTQTAQSGGVTVIRDLHAAGPVVARDNITIIQGAAAASTTITSLHQLPPPPADFTGRTEELAELMAAVEKGGATISGVQGMGGVGKTVLALKLAEQLTPRYRDAQFYLDLKGVSTQPLPPKSAMEHVIRAYHPDAKLPEQEAELMGLYQSVLHNQKAILLMDNARDAQQVEPLIPPSSCLLLVTSRQHFALPGLVAKNLEVLPPTDARALLLRIAPRLAKDAQDSTGELARLCGYLPLALRSVGSALAARIDLSPADFARRLADARERLKLTATDASLQLSYDLLATDLQNRFRALAAFPDTFDAAAAAAVWEVERAPAQDALSQLLVYSLVEFRSDAARYRLHDLVRLFADARLEKTERATAQRHHAEYYKEVAGAADALYLQGGESLKKGLALFDVEWPNIQAGQAWAAAHATNDDDAAALCSAYPDAGTYCLDLRLHPRERIRWLEAALAAARRLKDRGAEGAHLGNLGNAYHALGAYRRAIEYREQRLQIAREIGDRRGEANALGNIGVAHYRLGEHPRAIEYHEQALAIHRGIADRRGEGNGLVNLGNAYFALDEFRNAIERYERALAIHREIGDRRGEGGALGSLGNAYGGLAEYRLAIECHAQAVAIHREIGDRYGEGNGLGNLGNTYLALGEPGRAIEYCKHQLQITREIGDRQGEGNALWNMSLAFDQLGERARAIPLAEEALKIREQIESPYAAQVRTQLAEWRK